MTFDRTITIEPYTGRAILFADTPMGRFRASIDPRYANDLWGLPRPLDAATFISAIREHIDEIIKAAINAYADGELVLQLD